MGFTQNLGLTRFLIAVVIVIVDPVINDRFDLIESLAARQVDFIFHMTEETLLRSIIPAVASAGHRLPQTAVFEDLDKTKTGIVAALVAVDQRLGIQGHAVFSDQDIDRFKNKVQFKGWTEDISQDLLCIGVQDRG